MANFWSPLWHRDWIVLFTDGTEEKVHVSLANENIQSDDHLTELITAASNRPDDVDDFWKIEDGFIDCGHCQGTGKLMEKNEPSNTTS
ncbi:MAG: hypothetical protein ABIQ02_13775 [Saprospiraceae bacterium]